jgi:sensor c-di-GMP phosphodiesterase-like protein
MLATILGAACGALAGYLLGGVLTLKRTEIRLEQSAERTMVEADASSREARAILAELNTSPYPYCSDAEIAYFRDLLFQSEFLKETGRMRDGKIECSATLGRLKRPATQYAPDLAQPDGIKVYIDPAPLIMGDKTVIGLQLGDSYVVLSPYLETHRAALPIRHASTAIYYSKWQSGKAPPGLPQATRAILTTRGHGRLGDSLYATDCSALYYNCVTDYISIPDALEAGHSELILYIVLGALIGASFGFVCSFAYRRNRSMAQQLRRAIHRDKLRVVYQPIVELATRRIVGAEALARWTDEEGYVVGPDIFVRLAEERGFVKEVTKLVLRHILRDFADVFRSHPDFCLNMNVAVIDLADPDFLPMLDVSLDEAGVSARNLALEITESSTAWHQFALETILRLRQRGFGVEIDDFGTGYSSLSYLQDLAVDSIKIDRAFTHAIGTESVTVSILPQILAMAKTLGLGVVVEGIETEQQADYFAVYDQPILAQGWLFGQPVPPDEFHRLLAEDEMTILVSANAI